MPLGFYRYFSHQEELLQVQRHKKLQSTNPATGGATWWTPTRYENPVAAQRELALSRPPKYRYGPVPVGNMPEMDIAFRTVAPANGQPGGGVEVRTMQPLWLFGLWDFAKDNWAAL